jgi:lysozyme family protein
MAKENFVKVLPRELVYEGGKVDDPRDPGGRTAFGITQRTYDAWRRANDLPTRDVWLISSKEIDIIFKEMYWDRIHGDQLPSGLDLVVMDAAVNSGVGRATLWLQQSLPGFIGQKDGDFGPKTVQAALDDADLVQLIQDFCAHRLGTLKKLKTFKTYGKGWSARIANVQKAGVAWAQSAEAPHPVNVISLDGHRKATVPDNVVKPPISVMAANVSTTVGAVSTTATSLGTQLAPVADTFTKIKYVLAGLTIVSAVGGVIVKIIDDASKAAEAGSAKGVVDLDADNWLPSIDLKDVA